MRMVAGSAPIQSSTSQVSEKVAKEVNLPEWLRQEMKHLLPTIIQWFLSGGQRRRSSHRRRGPINQERRITLSADLIGG
jgi:hypothetical protein